MTGYGLIAAIPLFRKYKTAKAEYEALLEKQAGLQAAVASYNSSKLDSYLAYIAKDEPDNIYPEGVFVTTVLRVGNCVGNWMRVHNCLVFTNTSNNTYYIGTCYADSSIDKCKVPVLDISDMTEDLIFNQILNPFEFSIQLNTGLIKIINQVSYGSKLLAPGQSIEVYLPKGVSILLDEEAQESKMGYLRDLICAAAGKKLITSCPKTSIDGAQTANIRFDWNTKEEGIKHTCILRNKPGVLRYCGEAYYPKD